MPEFHLSDGRARVTVVFILSAERSGSTWLNLVLGSCSWAANLGEFYRLWKWPGHVACRLCEADGLAECRVLAGVEAAPLEDAFAFAAARTGKRVLIDCSKVTEWCDAFLGDERIEPRLIHLTRHPAGFVASQRRRNPARTIDDCLGEWVEANQRIEAFVSARGAPAFAAAYDQLADHPRAHFPALCDFIGAPFEHAALNYWEFEHHGLGGNGAASVFLKGRERVNYVTGDDAYYAQIETRPPESDVRFRTSLTEDERRACFEHPYARALAQRIGAIWRP